MQNGDGALAGIRVLECGDFVAPSYATKQLADLGAEVVKVETPGRGDTARHRGPYAGGIVDLDASGLFLYLNTNKRGIAVDLTRPEGGAILERLVRDADLLVHNAAPETSLAAALDYESLRRSNPSLVVTAISAFGSTGPRRAERVHDLNLWCAGGIAFLNGGGTGSDELPPLKAFGQQAGFQAGLHAAVASLGALYAAADTHEGQLVEVSVQECLLSIMEMAFSFYPYMNLVPSRLGRKPIQPLDFLQCKDGWIFICCVEEHQWHCFVNLAGNPEWASIELFENRLTRAENWDALKLFLDEYASTRTVEELYHDAQARRIPFAPVSTMGDLLSSSHLEARGFFATIADPNGRAVTMPGAPYRHSATPWRIRRRAPRLGEHTQEVLAEAGFTASELAPLRKGGVVA